MAVIHVNIAGAPYEVQIETGLLAAVGQHCRPFIRGGKVAVVTDERVAAAWRDTVATSLAAEGDRKSVV